MVRCGERGVDEVVVVVMESFRFRVLVVRVIVDIAFFLGGI